MLFNMFLGMLFRLLLLFLLFLVLLPVRFGFLLRLSRLFRRGIRFRC